MYQVYSSLLELGASKDWLIAANFILSVLLAWWMFRYRRLYFRAQDEQESGRDLVDNLAEGIYRSTPDGRMLNANPALVRLNGYSTKEELITGVNDIAREWYVDPQRRDEFRAILDRDGKIEDFVSEVYRHNTRERIWISEAGRVVRHKKTGKALYYEGSVREITETMKRLQLEEQFQKLTSQLPGGLFQLAREKGGKFSVAYLSSGFKRLLNIPDEVHFHDPYVFISHIHEADREGYFRTMRESGEKLIPWNYEMRVRTADGSQKWLKITATPERSNGATIWHGYMGDVSVRKKYEMEIAQLAFYDPLTHLPNRRLLFDSIARAAEDCRRLGGSSALLFIDLDNFKTLNDTQGHDIGDALLIEVAKRLKKSVRADDIVSRIGGDEFVVLLEKLGSDGAIATARTITVANQLLAALHAGCDIGCVHHYVSASIGVVVFDGREERPEELLKRADVAMYQAKAAGRDGVALHSEALGDKELVEFAKKESPVEKISQTAHGRLTA